MNARADIPQHHLELLATIERGRAEMAAEDAKRKREYIRYLRDRRKHYAAQAGEAMTRLEHESRAFWQGHYDRLLQRYDHG